jgi:hypothetical protein
MAAAGSSDSDSDEDPFDTGSSWFRQVYAEIYGTAYVNAVEQITYTNPKASICKTCAAGRHHGTLRPLSITSRWNGEALIRSDPYAAFDYDGSCCMCKTGTTHGFVWLCDTCHGVFCRDCMADRSLTAKEHAFADGRNWSAYYAEHHRRVDVVRDEMRERYSEEEDARHETMFRASLPAQFKHNYETIVAADPRADSAALRRQMLVSEVTLPAGTFLFRAARVKWDTQWIRDSQFESDYGGVEPVFFALDPSLCRYFATNAEIRRGMAEGVTESSLIAVRLSRDITLRNYWSKTYTNDGANEQLYAGVDGLYGTDPADGGGPAAMCVMPAVKQWGEGVCYKMVDKRRFATTFTEVILPADRTKTCMSVVDVQQFHDPHELAWGHVALLLQWRLINRFERAREPRLVVTRWEACGHELHAVATPYTFCKAELRPKRPGCRVTSLEYNIIPKTIKRRMLGGLCAPAVVTTTIKARGCVQAATFTWHVFGDPVHSMTWHESADGESGVMTWHDGRRVQTPVLRWQTGDLETAMVLRTSTHYIFVCGTLASDLDATDETIPEDVLCDTYGFVVRVSATTGDAEVAFVGNRSDIARHLDADVSGALAWGVDGDAVAVSVVDPEGRASRTWKAVPLAHSDARDQRFTSDLAMSRLSLRF